VNGAILNNGAIVEKVQWCNSKKIGLEKKIIGIP
jgi:hypothetical protein